jgi:DNA-binding CsgD family transcriptional regulator
VNVEDTATLVALGRIAIHTGDGRRARKFARLAEGGLEHGATALRQHSAWLLALQAMAEGDAAGARARLADLGEDAVVSVLPLVMGDVTDHPQLVRIALAAGDEELARVAVAAAEEACRLNPGVKSIAAAAAHARGLVERDPSTLAHATELFAAGPRSLARASAHEDHGLALVRDGNRARGVAALGHALQIYSNTGATWDESRVRRRLRELGVRRRLVKAARPTTGWAGLTDAEVAVVRLVADGLTNREVAERLFLSRHTVSMHLRHVFTKLDINSRVELTRLAFEHEQAA